MREPADRQARSPGRSPLSWAVMTEQRLPRILIVTRNLPPLVGGMERLNWHMASELSKVAEVRIVGPHGSAALAPQDVDVIEVPLEPLWKFLSAAANQARRVAKRWKPDIILAGSGLTAPPAWWAARSCGARTAAYVHGLDIAIEHPVYRSLWIPAIRQMDVLIANSSSTAALGRRIGVERARIAIVHPGVEPPEEGSGPLRQSPADYNDQRNAFRSRHQLGSRPVLLSVGRFTARKGLEEFVVQALPRIAATRPEVMLLVVGDAPSQALHAPAQSRESIQAAAVAAGVGSNLRFLGRLTDVELGAAYQAADVHVFPVREISGDPEGFGMVAVEAASHGLPTVAFAAGGIVEAVSEGESGRLVSPGDYPALAAAVGDTLASGVDLRKSCVAFAREFAWPAFGESVSTILLAALAARDGTLETRT